MPHSRRSFRRAVRVRGRYWLRRLTRETPEWMQWLAPWGSSIAIHALALLILALLVYLNGDWRLPEPKALRPIAGQLRDDVTSLRDADRAGDPFTDQVAAVAPSLSMHPDQSSEVYDVVTPATVRLEERLQLEPPAPSSTGREGSGAATGPGGTGKAGGPPSAPYRGRTGDMRAQLVRREGGTAESEKAVERGLEWLARHQRPDGAWSMDTSPFCRGNGCPPRRATVSDTAATGLALLPFLGAGHTHTEKGRYQQVVGRGLHWLRKRQRPNGELYLGGPFNAEFYSHAIATMALCEAYGITRDPGLKANAQKALNFICRSQNKADGGWRYVLGQPGDTSVFGWQMLALRSGSLAGLDVDRAVIRRCRTFLDSVAATPNGSAYSYLAGRPPSATMTGAGLLVRQYMGWTRESPAMLEGTAALTAMADEEGFNSYYWYYTTQILHNLKGKDWPKWNAYVRDSLVACQATGEGCDRGSWDPEQPEWDRWSIVGGRLYLTSLSLLTLEVYYRYLPLYRDTDGAIAGAEDAALASEAGGNAEDAEPKPGKGGTRRASP